MSSPLAGLPHSSSDFLARWMPSSTRAGVILDPGSLWYDSPGAAVPSEPEDFAPIATSVDSSCLDVESLSGAGRLEETSNSSQEVSITMKLDQVGTYNNKFTCLIPEWAKSKNLYRELPPFLSRFIIVYQCLQWRQSTTSVSLKTPQIRSEKFC